MSNQSIKKDILASIQKAQQMGYTLICEDWGNNKNKCACAIGCVFVADGREPDVGDPLVAATILDVSEGWVSSFIDGFDNNGTAVVASDAQAWKIGNELRKELKPIPINEFIDMEPLDD